jgi:hypothetical protein
MSFALKQRRQPPQLSRLARTIQALKRNEKTVLHALSLLHACSPKRIGRSGIINDRAAQHPRATPPTD